MMKNRVAPFYLGHGVLAVVVTYCALSSKCGDHVHDSVVL
jgi:hypothetical protein